MPSQHVTELTDTNFQNEVLESDKPVLVDFWAPWCGPCRAIAPHVEALAEEYQGHLKVGKINLDENPQTPQQHAIRSIPTLLLFKNGQVVDQVVGAVGRDKLEDMVKGAL